MGHDPACGCDLCRQVRAYVVPVLPQDFEALAREWRFWVSETSGEVWKLRYLDAGNPGSPRWVALQAIARSRMAAWSRIQPVEPGSIAENAIIRAVVKEFPNGGLCLERALRRALQLAFVGRLAAGTR